MPLVEQASAASQSMADQAKGLGEMMERYQVSAQAAAAAQAPTSRGVGAAKRAAPPSAGQAERARAPVKAVRKPAVRTAAGGDDWTEF